jgi:hypothetical protein
VNLIATNSSALPQNGDGVKDAPTVNQPSLPGAPSGMIGTIINTKA